MTNFNLTLSDAQWHTNYKFASGSLLKSPTDESNKSNLKKSSFICVQNMTMGFKQQLSKAIPSWAIQHFWRTVVSLPAHTMLYTNVNLTSPSESSPTLPTARAGLNWCWIDCQHAYTRKQHTSGQGHAQHDESFKVCVFTTNITQTQFLTNKQRTWDLIPADRKHRQFISCTAYSPDTLFIEASKGQGCWLLHVPSHMLVYLSDQSAQTLAHVVTLWEQLQNKLAISSSHSILTSANQS